MRTENQQRIYLRELVLVLVYYRNMLRVDSIDKLVKPILPLWTLLTSPMIFRISYLTIHRTTLSQGISFHIFKLFKCNR